jgi:hypothetical protein
MRQRWWLMTDVTDAHDNTTASKREGRTLVAAKLMLRVACHGASRMRGIHARAGAVLRAVSSCHLPLLLGLPNGAAAAATICGHRG